MTTQAKTMVDKVMVAFVTAIITFLMTLAWTGLTSINRAEAQTMINESMINSNQDQVKTDAKVDQLLRKVTSMEISQARLEEKVDALRAR